MPTFRMVASDNPRCERIEKRADPTMMHTWRGELIVVRFYRYGDIGIQVGTYHETGEDHAKRSGPCVEDGRPEEDEDVHARLQQGLHAPQQQDLLILKNMNENQSQ